MFSEAAIGCQSLRKAKVMAKSRNPRGPRWRLSYLLLITALALGGCTTLFATENIDWAREQNFRYVVVVLPADQWAVAAHMRRFDPTALCVFVAPASVLVRSDVEIMACLNHELGHMREHHEGHPYHSKYAW